MKLLLKRGEQLEEELKKAEKKEEEDGDDSTPKKKSSKKPAKKGKKGKRDMEDEEEDEEEEEEEEDDEGDDDEGDDDEDFQGIQSIIERKKKEALLELEKFDPLAQECKPDQLEINLHDWDMGMSALHFAIFFGCPKGFFYFSIFNFIF